MIDEFNELYRETRENINSIEIKIKNLENDIIELLNSHSNIDTKTYLNVEIDIIIEALRNIQNNIKK